MSTTTTLRWALLALVAPLGVVAAPAGAQTSCDGLLATIVVAPDPDGWATDPVTGTPGADVIVGTDANDTIDGAGGNDTICGLAGADILIGGEGDDRLFGGLDLEYVPDDGYVGDLLVPGQGDDHVDLGSDPAAASICECDAAIHDQVSFRDAAGPVHVDLAAGTATGEGTDTVVVPDIAGGIVGSAHDDVLVGSPVVDLIDGGGGDDTITAGAGDDLLYPDAVGRVGTRRLYRADLPGDDTVVAGPGDDWVEARFGIDEMRGGSGSDDLTSTSTDPGGNLSGGGGADTLGARAGTTLLGGGGGDMLGSTVDPEVDPYRLAGGQGKDSVSLVLRGDFGRDPRITVDVPRQKVVVGGTRYVSYAGNEWLSLSAGGGVLTYRGGRGDEVLHTSRAKRVVADGRGGRDQLHGGAGRDALSGGAGNDQLYGSQGTDRLDGGRGYDTCRSGERMEGCERGR